MKLLHICNRKTQSVYLNSLTNKSYTYRFFITIKKGDFDINQNFICENV